MIRDDDEFTVTSVSLPVSVKRWLKENVSNRSALITELLLEHINHVEGYANKIERLEARRRELVNEIESVEKEIEESRRLEQERLRGEREERERRLRELEPLYKSQ